MSVSNHQHASSASVRRAINAASKAGMTIGSLMLHPDGGIEIVASLQSVPQAMNDFDRLEATGAL